ncbi:MAG TPA: rhodanese-like domain-containing protein [Methylomirabilota bacterium]|jgi:rhodanese-related sulfurtransferase
MMITQVTREGVRDLAEAGAQVVDVLSRRAYDELHIAGALNIPLDRLGTDAAGELRRDLPVIVYCNDYT